MGYNNEALERDLNPPGIKKIFEPDIDAINDEIWLLNRQTVQEKDNEN